MPNVDWDMIKAEYLQGDTSQRKLAEKYNVSLSTLRRRAEKQHWFEQRVNVERKAGAKVAQKIVDQRANTAVKVHDVGLKLLARIEKAIDDLPEKSGTRVDQEIVGKAQDGTPKKVRIESDLAKLANAFSATARTLYDARLELDRERFVFEQKKYETEQARNGGVSIDQFNEKIASIAELIQHPLPNRTIDAIESGTDGDDDA